jgi:hypothetical protein
MLGCHGSKVSGKAWHRQPILAMFAASTSCWGGGGLRAGFNIWSTTLNTHFQHICTHFQQIKKNLYFYIRYCYCTCRLLFYPKHNILIKICW